MGFKGSNPEHLIQASSQVNSLGTNSGFGERPLPTDLKGKRNLYQIRCAGSPVFGLYPKCIVAARSGLPRVVLAVGVPLREVVEGLC
jgi:hypothetical protein